MNPPRVPPEDDTQFLLATPRASTCAEAARVPPAGPRAPSHNAFTRLPHRLEPEPAEFRAEVAPLVDRGPASGSSTTPPGTSPTPGRSSGSPATGPVSTGRWSTGSTSSPSTWADAGGLYPTDYRMFQKAANVHLGRTSEASAREGPPE